LVVSANGFDKGIYLDSIHGFFPHVPFVSHEPPFFFYSSQLCSYHLVFFFSRASYRVLAQGVIREGDAIVHVASSSAYPIVNPPSDLPLRRLPISAYRLTPRSSGVDVEHIAQVIPIRPSFANRLILSEEARAPRKLAQVIEERGFAPFFVRWSDGPVDLVGDDGDLARNKVSFRFALSGRAKLVGRPQLGRFEWSVKTFPDGVAFRLEPAHVAKVSRVEGAPRTLEFEWRPESFEDAKDKTATLTLERSGSGVKLNDEQLVDIVSRRRFDEMHRQKSATTPAAIVPFPGAVHMPKIEINVVSACEEVAEVARARQVCWFRLFYSQNSYPYAPPGFSTRLVPFRSTCRMW
jgi:hypothetical protein